jgi:hypothetical protein
MTTTPLNTYPSSAKSNCKPKPKATSETKILVLDRLLTVLNHNILLSKLRFYGVNGKTKSWFDHIIITDI